MRDFNYKIVEAYGVISEKKSGLETLEINAISYNGRETKIDIRRWDKSEGKKMLKGVAMSYGEAKGLRDILNRIDFDENGGEAL